MRCARIGYALLWCLYLSACGALVPKPFHPMNAEEEAVTRTIQRCLEAIRMEDFEAIRRISLPEASLEMIISGHSTGRQSLSQGVPGEIVRPVQQVSSPTLSDFRRLSAAHVSVTSYLVIDTIDTVEKIHLRWDLTRRGEEWLILNFRAMLSSEPFYIRGGGS